MVDHVIQVTLTTGPAQYAMICHDDLRGISGIHGHRTRAGTKAAPTRSPYSSSTTQKGRHQCSTYLFCQMQFIVHRSLSSKLLIPLLLTALVVVASVLAVVSYTRSRAVEEAGVATGRAMTSQVVTLRNFYTAEIAARAKKAGMALGIDFRDKNNTLPLPATLVKALGESITQEFPGTHLRLLSRYPFPHRAADNKLDVFQAQALAALEGDSKTPVHSVEPVDGRLSVRYAVADVMKEGCVACHNSHPQSPKRDWKVGDVRGIIEVVVPVDRQLQQRRAIRDLDLVVGRLAALEQPGSSFVVDLVLDD